MPSSNRSREPNQEANRACSAKLIRLDVVIEAKKINHRQSGACRKRTRQSRWTRSTYAWPKKATQKAPCTSKFSMPHTILQLHHHWTSMLHPDFPKLDELDEYRLDIFTNDDCPPIRQMNWPTHHQHLPEPSSIGRTAWPRDPLPPRPPPP